MLFWHHRLRDRSGQVAKSVHSTFSKLFCKHIRSLRERAGITQRELAALMGKAQSMVVRVETGERRLDVVEAYWWFKALGADPSAELAKLGSMMAAADPDNG